jgi:hypothetical protein
MILNVIKIFFLYLFRSLIKVLLFFKYKIKYLSYHLVISFYNKKIKVNLLEHQEYLKKLGADLKQLQQELEPSEFLLRALKKANKCQFIVFDTPDQSGFVQFAYGKKKMMTFDFPVPDEDHSHNQYFLQVIGLLSTIGFERDFTLNNKWPKKKYTYTIFDQPDIKDVMAEFEDEYQAASTLTEAIVTKLFNKNVKDLLIMLG